MFIYILNTKDYYIVHSFKFEQTGK